VGTSSPGGTRLPSSSTATSLRFLTSATTQRLLEPLMNQVQETARNAAIAILFAAFCFVSHAAVDSEQGKSSIKIGPVMVHRATAFDVSPPLASLRDSHAAAQPPNCEGEACGLSPDDPDIKQQPDPAPAPKPVITEAGAAVEQRSPGRRSACVYCIHVYYIHSPCQWNLLPARICV
jgi:hypothetical protein